METGLDRYEILERLGEGGLGEVFRARDTRLGRTVVIKRARAELVQAPGPRARLITTAERLTSLSHPNVAELYEIVERENEVALVFEHVAGDPLTRVMGGQPLNPRRAAELAAQIADGVAAAHAVGILHLDLRPETVLVSTKGRAKIVDCGLSDFSRAAAARRAAVEQGPEAGAAATSLLYMSPEQALGENEDERSDIFSLGAIFYEMLTGAAPFAGPGAEAPVLSVLRTTPPPPSERNPAVPRYYDAIVSRMLAKSLHGRYQAAASAAADLRNLAERRDPPARAAPDVSGSRWRIAAIGGALVAAMAGLLWWVLWSS